MAGNTIKRRDFMSGGALVAGALAGGLGRAQVKGEKKASGTKILNYNENMEYHRLGKTGLMVSAVCMGGHWKRIGKAVIGVEGTGYAKTDQANVSNADFIRNRHDVLSHCMEVGINYVDACTGEEVQAYAKALKGRRDKMYLGYSWYQKGSEEHTSELQSRQYL